MTVSSQEGQGASLALSQPLMSVASLSKPVITIHTDGACSGNPGPGGYGAIITGRTKTLEILGGEPATTNNRMELMAAIVALEALRKPRHVHLVSDSEYLVKGASQWIHGWRTRGWKKVKNVDLWQRLEALMAVHVIEWEWVRGHAGHPMNERADRLAGEGLLRQAQAKRYHRHPA